MIRVVIAKDSPDIRDGLSSLIDGQSDFFVVGTAGDGLEKAEMAKDQRPDIVMLDAQMPMMDGYRGYQENKTRPPPHRHFVPEQFHLYCLPKGGR